MLYGFKEIIQEKLLNLVFPAVIAAWQNNSPSLDQTLTNHLREISSLAVDIVLPYHSVFDNTELHGRLNKKQFVKDFLEIFYQLYESHYISTKRKRDLQQALNREVSKWKV